jgi:hypothetical protein
MRHTELPEEGFEPFTSYRIQSKLDIFWSLIEDKYEEEWRIDFSGAMVLRVDDAMLERILKDNVATAWYSFGAFYGGQREDGTRFFLSRPDYLLGLWSIEGVYSNHYTLVDGPRTYSFEPGA